MKSLSLIALLAGSIGVATFVVPMAEARGGPGGERPAFETLDSDGDGSITQAELDALRASRFAEIDTDGDGSVTLEEFVAHAQARSADRAEMMFGRMDADGDGVLSRDVLEMGRGFRGVDGGGMIARLDTDGDGAISAEEFEAMHDRRAGIGGKRGRHFGHGDGPHRQ